MPFMNSQELISYVITALRRATTAYTPPLIDQIIEEFGHDPYLILISCLLSLRAKDTTTIHVCRELFTIARTPEQMLSLTRPDLEKLVFKTGFYRNKAKVLHKVSAILIQEYKSMVPETLEQLLGIRGVGRKTANLVMGMAFATPAICVDTHVHRISNRLGLIATKTVEETEHELMRVLPKEHWIEWNNLLVVWGQNICAPISPKCSQCPLRNACARRGVLKSR